MSQVADGVMRTRGGALASAETAARPGRMTWMALAASSTLFVALAALHELRDVEPLKEHGLAGAGLVVLRFDTRTPPPIAFNRCTHGVIATIRTRYALQTTYPGYWLYTPRPRSSATFVEVTRR